jgi:hypothetical protein
LKFEFNSIIELRFSCIEFKFNWKEMGCKLVEKGIENLHVNMVLEKKIKKKTTSSFENGLNKK